MKQMKHTLSTVVRPISAAFVIATAGGCASLSSGTPAGPAMPLAAVAAASAPRAPAPPPAAAGSAPRVASVASPIASGVPPGTPQPSAPPASSLTPFATLTKDTKKIDGLFTLYQKDEKVWLELRPEDFNKPFFLSPKLATGIGEEGLFGGSMLSGRGRVIEFRRIHNLVQMIARNTEFTAKPASPEGRSVAASFSPSLLASTPIASAPQSERKSVLVDAGSLFVNDMFAIGSRLQRVYRQGYGFDGRNSAITTINATPEAVSLQVLSHYAAASIAVPQPGSPPGAPVPTVPSTVPDPRSLFVTLHYTLSTLPERAMPPRAADSRVGYFTANYFDFTDDLARTPVVRHVNRWRLEKKDPQAALSEPVKPIVYVLDRTVPVKYREAITAGVLEWNKAFERIGFKDAIEVKIQPEADPVIDTLDGGASIRWMSDSAPQFGAIGPSHVDPRSGEILAANIGIEGLSSRNRRTLRSETLAPNTTDWARLMQFNPTVSSASSAIRSGGQVDFDPAACEAADLGAEQLGYALDVLAARGDIDPTGAEADAFVLEYLKDVTMHEVGHTLGLRHNFRASRIYSDQQLSDPEFTRTHALTGSVMEYAAVNLAAPGARPVSAFQSTLGPYDYWAIEYAYKPIAPADEKAELARIASRSNERELAFGTDEDNFLGIDPETLQSDLGDDELAFARKRFAIARDLFKRQESRALPPEQDYAVLRRSLNYAINDVARSVGVLARQIGGVRTLRDHPGSGREPLQPVPVAQQREALDAIARGLLAADSFIVTPQLQRRLAPDFQERTDAIFGGSDSVATEFSPPQRLFEVQRALLTQLMSDAVAVRILDNQGATRAGGDALQLSELYARLDRDIWSELRSGSDIPSPRRELQREHLNRLAALLLRPSAASRADTRGLMRTQAQDLLARVQRAERSGALSADARAHLKDCDETLTQALSARLLRVGL
jgi:hypothetical protein